MDSKSEASILDLVRQMTRSRETGQTADEERQLQDGVQLAKEIWQSCEKFHQDNGGALDTFLCLRAVSLTLGLLVKRHRAGGDPGAGLIIGISLCEAIMSLATDPAEESQR